jgi:signal recognition particle subunit SEC65
MLNFKEYMISQPDFNEVIKAVDEAMTKEKYQDAWELIDKSRPRNEEEASLKAMYVAEFQNRRDEFLKAMKKGQV